METFKSPLPGIIHRSWRCISQFSHGRHESVAFIFSDDHWIVVETFDYFLKSLASVLLKKDLCLVVVAQAYGHYKLDNIFPSTTRMPFMSLPNIFIIVVIFYYNELWRYLFKIIYSLVHVLEQYCTVAFAVEVVYFLSLFLFEVCMHIYKTLSDHVLVLCGLYFLYYKPPCYCILNQEGGNYYPICSGLMGKAWEHLSCDVQGRRSTSLLYTYICTHVPT